MGLARTHPSHATLILLCAFAVQWSRRQLHSACRSARRNECERVTLCPLTSSYSKFRHEHVGDAAQHGDEVECVPFIAEVVLERDMACLSGGVASTYPQAESDDLQNALHGEERSECGIRVGQHVVVRRWTSIVLEWRNNTRSEIRLSLSQLTFAMRTQVFRAIMTIMQNSNHDDVQICQIR